jgi:hypothetical protein
MDSAEEQGKNSKPKEYLKMPQNPAHQMRAVLTAATEHTHPTPQREV